MAVHRAPLALAACLGLTTFARAAVAAPPWVERPLTLPSGNVAFDLGAGFFLPPPEGAGLNLEMGIGLTSRIELGIRTALRFGDAFERAIEPDVDGRLFDRQTFDTGGDAIANPEVRLRGALVRGEVGEVALEGRVVLPFEAGTGLGLMFGVPVALHLGDRVRIDTGGYVPLFVWRRPVAPDLHNALQARLALSVPFDVWIQATPRFWIGPVSEVVVAEGGAGYELGLGLGYEITHAIDFKAMAVSPHSPGLVEHFALGVGLQIRVE